MKLFKYFFVLNLLVLFISCNKEKNPAEKEHLVNSMSDLKLNENFNFETSKRVTVTFTDNKQLRGSQVKYDIYLYSSIENSKTVTYVSEGGESVQATVPIFDMQNNKIASIITKETSFDLDLVIPNCYHQLYVVRNEMGLYSSYIIDIYKNRATYKRNVNRSITERDTVDIFYAVNSLSEVLTINQSTGEIAKVTNIPNGDGSWACAIDPLAKKLYTISFVGNKNLYAYDIERQTWETIGVGIMGPRLGYNVNDGMLYFSTSKYVYVIDPKNANIIASYTINGLQTLSGGDLTFSADGTMYISSTTGLYRCEFGDGNVINATWISSESLPNYPNSLTFETAGQLWWATNYTVSNTHGRIFIMDTATGAWEDRFSPYEYYIHDLATLPYDANTISDVDSDGDGVSDFYDEFPNDGSIASSTYTPSMFGWGTYAFEDLWPYTGDYDFNDLVVNYRYTNVLNAEGLLVKTILKFDVKNVGGSYKNGFGIELNMDESKISTVTGYNLTEGIVNLNSKGLELNQDKPVVIVFDNAWKNYNANSILELTIEYTEPINPNNFGNLNPFIFIDEERGREVHMSNKKPTSLADRNLLSTGNDKSNFSKAIYYKNENNLPWAIDIIHDFVCPLEKHEIIWAYPYFVNWAESSGTSYTDWYKDKSGYRDKSHLKK